MTTLSARFWTAYAALAAFAFLAYVAATAPAKSPPRALRCVEVPYKAQERGAQCVRRVK